MSMYGSEPEWADPGHWRTDEDYPERVDPPTCDECYRPINIGAVSLQGVGLFCSHKCANKGAAKHEARMSRQPA